MRKVDSAEDTNLRRNAYRVRELSALPRWRLALRRPLVVWALNCVTAVALGEASLGALFVQTFLNGDYYRGGRFVAVVGQYGLCGEFRGWDDFYIILCRLFLHEGYVLFVYVPFFFLGLLAWTVLSLRSRKPLWYLSRSERWLMIVAMLLVSLFSVVLGLAMLPEYILFTGPIHGFHPLMPLALSTAGLLTPLIVWIFLDFGDRRFIKNMKGASDHG